jgi:hypothetical protein
MQHCWCADGEQRLVSSIVGLLTCSLGSCFVHDFVHEIAPCLLILLVGNDRTDLNQERLQGRGGDLGGGVGRRVSTATC